MSSPVNRPLEILHVLRDVFSVIGNKPPYTSNIGRSILIGDVVGSEDDLPGMGIEVTSGRWLDPTTDTAASSHSRSLDLFISAAVQASTQTALYAGLNMLQDIETALSRRDVRRMVGVGQIRLTQWQIVDRPDGIDAVLLLITAEADYTQPRHQ